MSNQPFDPLQVMKDKRSAIEFLLKALDNAERYNNGLDNVITALEKPDVSQATINKFTKTTANIVRDQQMLMRHLIVFSLIYIGGDSFTTDAAKTACKFGQGQEALQEIMRQKMGVNF